MTNPTESFSQQAGGFSNHDNPTVSKNIPSDEATTQPLDLTKLGTLLSQDEKPYTDTTINSPKKGLFRLRGGKPERPEKLRKHRRLRELLVNPVIAAAIAVTGIETAGAIATHYASESVQAPQEESRESSRITLDTYQTLDNKIVDLFNQFNANSKPDGYTLSSDPETGNFRATKETPDGKGFCTIMQRDPNKEGITTLAGSNTIGTIVTISWSNDSQNPADATTISIIPTQMGTIYPGTPFAASVERHKKTKSFFKTEIMVYKPRSNELRLTRERASEINRTVKEVLASIGKGVILPPPPDLG